MRAENSVETFYPPAPITSEEGMKKKVVKLKIIADRREEPSGVTEALRELGVDVELQQLAVGDFVLSPRLGVERKSVGDFLQSLIDGRLLNQAKLLRETFERPIIILEGKELYERRAIHPNAVRGALAALTVDLGVPIVPTEDEEDTANLLTAMAKREQVQEFKEMPLRRKVRGLTLAGNQRFILEGLPGISAILAKRLLEHFKTIEQVMCASEKELRKVRGIGKEKAKIIRGVLTAPYEPEKSESQS
jgi:Fanconi anemia group M protein